MANLLVFPTVAPGTAAIYRAYRFSPNGSVRSTIPVDALDDDAARRLVVTLLDGHRLELWARGRFVAHVTP